MFGCKYFLYERGNNLVVGKIIMLDSDFNQNYNCFLSKNKLQNGQKQFLRCENNTICQNGVLYGMEEEWSLNPKQLFQNGELYNSKVTVGGEKVKCIGVN